METLVSLLDKLSALTGVPTTDLITAICVAVPIAAVLGWILLPRLVPRTPKPFPTITPQNTTFVIDLHEVLMHPNYWSMFRRIFFRRTGWKLLYAFWRPTNLGVMLELAKRPYGLVSEEAMLVMTREAERPLREPLMHIINDFSPDPAMLALLAHLKGLGYSVLLFSNIGELCFESMRQRQPEAFVSFTDFHVAQKAENYTKKPDPRAFQLFLRRFGRRADHQFILLDDKAANITAAAAASPNFRGAVFWSTWHFRRELQHWGVL